MSKFRKGEDGELSFYIGLAAAAIIVLILYGVEKAYPRDGSWPDTSLAQRKWFSTLMQPDNPEISCCGEADAYEADDFDVVDGHIIAIITDERGDVFPSGVTRPHIEPGTRIPIPDKKVKWDQGNPTGHGIVFLGVTLGVYCYVQPGLI